MLRKTRPETSLGVEIVPQEVVFAAGGVLHRIDIPMPNEQLASGLAWGSFDEALTPAFWKTHCWIDELTGATATPRLGRTLGEELVACLLNSHGVKAEVAKAAFERLLATGMIDRAESPPSAEEVSEILRLPVHVGARSVRYRFPESRGRYISTALARLRSSPPPVDSSARMQSWLLSLPGVGTKTASWILRNLFPEARVAVLDVHIRRAGLLTGFLPPALAWRGSYSELEKAFLNFADDISVAPFVLDMVMWDRMRRLGKLALSWQESS